MRLKFSFVLFVTILFCSFAKAQQVSIVNFTSGTFAKGAVITAQIKMSGCFDTTNKVRLFLSDTSRNFSGGGTLIGLHNAFFTPFVNGVIPGTTPAGNQYKIRVETTNPVTSAISSTFTIGVTTFSTISNLTPQSTDDKLNDSTFGSCNATPPSGGLVLTLNQAPGVFGVKISDSLGNNIAATIQGNSFLFDPISGNYYTATMAF